jgi:hypothetical protein
MFTGVNPHSAVFFQLRSSEIQIFSSPLLVFAKQHQQKIFVCQVLFGLLVLIVALQDGLNANIKNSIGKD